MIGMKQGCSEVGAVGRFLLHEAQRGRKPAGGGELLIMKRWLVPGEAFSARLEDPETDVRRIGLRVTLPVFAWYGAGGEVAFASLSSSSGVDGVRGCFPEPSLSLSFSGI